MPFREEDELEQFRLIVEQLEVCRDLVLAEVGPKLRMALILLDNTAEVMLYRISRKAFEHDKKARRVIPAHLVVPFHLNELRITKCSDSATLRCWPNPGRRCLFRHTGVTTGGAGILPVFSQDGSLYHTPC